MLESDASLIEGAFADSAILQTFSRSKEGKTVIINEQVSEFASSISKLKKERLMKESVLKPFV